LARRVAPGGGRKRRGGAGIPAGPGGAASAAEARAEGMKKIQKGDTKGALERFEAMAELRPRNPAAYSGVGSALLGAGAGKEALKFFEMALKLGDKRADTRLDMGGAHRMAGQLKESLECYRQVMSADPGTAAHVAAHSNMCSVYSDLGMYAEAAKSADAALRLDPSAVQAKTGKGVALMHLCRHQEAAAVLGEAVAAEPESYRAQAGLGGALSALGDAAGALECFEAAVRIDPSDLEAHFKKGVALSKMGEHRRAYEAFAEAGRIEPSSQICAGMALSLVRAHEGEEPGPWHAEADELADRAVGLDSDYAGAHYAKARVLEAAGRDSRGHAEAAARLDPEHGGDPSGEQNASDPRQNRMDAGMGMLEGDGNAAGAVAYFEALVEDEPDYAEGRAALGDALCRSGDPGAALAEFARAQELGADGERVYTGMGEAYDLMGEGQKAEQCYLKAASMGTGRTQAHISLATNYMGQGRLQEALGMAEDALRLQPGNAQANTVKGGALAEMGRSAESVPLLRAAVRALPDSFMAHKCLGQSLLDTDDAAGALRHLQEAARLDPGAVSAHHGMGDALGKLERFQEAYDAYARAAGIEPHAKTYSNMSIMLLNMNASAGPAAGKKWHGRAVSLADMAIKMDGKHAYAYCAKWQLLRASGDERGAAECFRELERLDPALAGRMGGGRA